MTEKRNHKKGRPTKVDKEVLNKIEYASAIGCNVLECCAYADISPTTYYKYMNQHKEYADRIAALKATPILKAKEQNMKLIESGDGVHIRWYLEHKAPDEFNTKQTLNIDGGAALSIKERSDALEDFLKRFSIE